MKSRIPALACIAWMGLPAAALLPAVAAPEDPPSIEEFSLYGAIAGEVAQLAQNVIQLGIAQASFQEEVTGARHDLHAQWTHPTERAAAASHLAALLFQKDLMYALLPLSEGATLGWERSKAFNQLSGEPLDGGIPSQAAGEFLHWVITVRGNLGVYGEEQLNPFTIADPARLLPALEKASRRTVTMPAGETPLRPRAFCHCRPSAWPPTAAQR